MIGEVAAVISALKALNDGISTLKESAGNAGSLQALVGRWASADEQYREVERRKAGALSYKDAIAMESAKRQLNNFDQQLKDICMMQGQFDLYTSIKQRMEEARLAHEKEVRRIKRRRAEIRKNLGIVGTVLFGWVCFMGFLWFVIWFVEQTQK
tara:strand:- start:645 stop:1106 length:462 start_codon:yes stop_codon:yes gene_type:complete